MNPKKQTKRSKKKQPARPPPEEDKFQSPLPKKNNPEADANLPFLQDLSPYRPIFGSYHTPLQVHMSHELTIIETPAHTHPARVSYLEQIDEMHPPISGVIEWTENNESQDLGDEDDSEIPELSQEEELNPVPSHEDPHPDPHGLSSRPPAKQSAKEKKQSHKKGNPAPSTVSGSKRVTCNCKKTQCLKLYCDCFRINQTCEGCNCVGCHNLPNFEEERNNAMLTLMDRNPEAFKPKIEEEQHSKGCHCKKSHCLKKYCQCFQAGLKCGENCKCDDCRNHSHDSDEQREQENGGQPLVINLLYSFSNISDQFRGRNHGTQPNDHLKSN